MGLILLQEIDLDLGQLIADNSLAFAILVLGFFILWKVVLPFWVNRENKREEARIELDKQRESERIAREARYLMQQDEYLKMVKGFEETIKTLDVSSAKRNDALISALGAISQKLETLEGKVDKNAK